VVVSIFCADKLATLGSAAQRIDNHTEFTGKLIDILKQGIGTLVDADLAEESAQLQSLQIRQQLGTQALAIANQRPSSILSLFQ
jgi:flagellin